MKQLEAVFLELGLPGEAGLFDQYRAYMEGILKWNEEINLTAIKSENEFIEKHFIDSLSCAKSAEFRKAVTIVDMGTGAGFPGVPLALAYSEKRFILVDSLAKRLRMIDQLCSKIGIKNVRTIHSRAEDLGQDQFHRENYDICLSRAVANLAVLSEYCLPLVKCGGTFIAYKGPDIDRELKESHAAVSMLGGRLKRAEEVKLPNFHQGHQLVYIKKEKSTPSKYPRKAGTPSKSPLKR
jgi:16S rRNA (guanine527-N7)-methyltransferase